VSIPHGTIGVLIWFQRGSDVAKDRQETIWPLKPAHDDVKLATLKWADWHNNRSAAPPPDSEDVEDESPLAV
jgi:hypothetical protein